MHMKTNTMIRTAFAGLVLTTLGLAACSGPTLIGRSDSVQLLPGEPYVSRQVGPYDNTANSLGGRFAGDYGGTD
jgi:hypothetical protein